MFKEMQPFLNQYDQDQKSNKGNSAFSARERGDNSEYQHRHDCTNGIRFVKPEAGLFPHDHKNDEDDHERIIVAQKGHH